MAADRLGARLRALRDAVDRPHDAVWDLAADHGLLADALLKTGRHGLVHAVDRVPVLCERMAQCFPALQVHCTDIDRLQLPGDKPDTLLILAGLGGDTVADLVESLIARHAGWPLKFLLCPVRQCWALRERLATLPLEVSRERLVRERGRIYEVMALQVVAVARESCRPWPAGQARWPADALLDRYLAERAHAHRHRPNIAAAYAACKSNREEDERQCVG